jgi:hypothetical protein
MQEALSSTASTGMVGRNLPEKGKGRGREREIERYENEHI